MELQKLCFPWHISLPNAGSFSSSFSLNNLWLAWRLSKGWTSKTSCQSKVVSTSWRSSFVRFAASRLFSTLPAESLKRTESACGGLMNKPKPRSYHGSGAGNQEFTYVHLWCQLLPRSSTLKCFTWTSQHRSKYSLEMSVKILYCKFFVDASFRIRLVIGHPASSSYLGGRFDTIWSSCDVRYSPLAIDIPHLNQCKAEIDKSLA